MTTREPLSYADGVNAHLSAHSCFDKAHRCPAWAGPGWKASETIKGVSECENGSIRVPKPGAETVSIHDDYSYDRPWSFGRCVECGIRTYPYAWRKYTPSYWRRLGPMRLRMWMQTKRYDLARRRDRLVDRYYDWRYGPEDDSQTPAPNPEETPS